MRYKNKCYTRRHSLYCPVCCESCNKLGFNGWDLKKTVEDFFVGCWHFESPPLSRLHPKLICKIINDDSCQQENTIQNFSCILYAHGVIFQQANCPFKNILNRKVYFSWKHKLYGFKIKVSVTPLGKAANIMDHKSGSISDLLSFRTT